MSFVNRILAKRGGNNDLVRNLIKNRINRKNHKYNNVGWLKDPLLSLNSNIPTHDDANRLKLQTCVDVDNKLISKIMELNKTGVKNSHHDFYGLADSYLDLVYNYKSLTSDDQPVNNKIIDIVESRFNFNALSTIHKYSRSLLSNKNTKPTSHDTIDTRNHNNEHSSYISQDSDYNFMRKSSVFYEKINSRLLRVSGSNSDYFLNQVLSSSVSAMCTGDVEYSCLLDSKGIILDTCFVSKLDGHYLLVTTGNKKNDVFDYISSYAVHLKAFSLDVYVNPLDQFKVVNLYGPLSYEVFSELLEDKANQMTIKHMDGSAHKDSRGLNNQGSELPKLFMKSFYINFMSKDYKITCYRVSDVEEGLEFIVPCECFTEFKNLLLSHGSVRQIGLETYEIARLEGGIVRPDVDLTPESTPLHSSLMWNVDVEKIRSKIIFGHRNFGNNIVEGISKMYPIPQPYLNLQASWSNFKYIAYAQLQGSNKINEDANSCNTKFTNRYKNLGLVTSSTFSPALGMYISHCYVDRDYAKHDTPVVISIPKAPDETVSKAKYKKYYRNNVLKTFCSGTIVRLPFIRHKPKVTTDHKPKNEQITYLRPRAKKMEEPKQLIRPEKATVVKTKKQIWKEIIKNHKKKINATLEMACKRWEEINKQINEEFIKKDAKTNETDTMEQNDLKNKLEYYKYKIGVDVSSRHRRYRPPRHTN
ncbi:aminomethyltransferase [Theileria orientalis]|uniref:Aminomethyltransferase n=1 Tax=Theileria orientalis TaxID=68886 RepID=A0A976XHJ1_THEOR|nr:aminomethyltransferase [Theileria orientalis]